MKEEPKAQSFGFISTLSEEEEGHSVEENFSETETDSSAIEHTRLLDLIISFYSSVLHVISQAEKL